jgi:hypothetical protein
VIPPDKSATRNSSRQTGLSNDAQGKDDGDMIVGRWAE